MQSTSPVWKGLFASGAALQARATVGGTVYTDIGVPVINRGTMQDRLAVGNVVSASLALALRSAGSVPRSAAVVIEVRMNDGQTASEWLPQGTFYISRRMRDPVTGLLALECYDALLKANALWTPSAGAWPRTLAAVTAELAALLGVALDSRTVIPTGAAYAMSEPDEGTTIRDALSLVAQAAGGNWIITPAGKLRLVRLGEAGDTVDVAGVVGGIDVGRAGTITGVRSTVDGVATLTGDDTGLVVDVALAPVIAVELAEALIGQAWQPFRLEGAVYDPAAELGDAVNAGANGEVAATLCSEQAAYGPAFRGDIAAPDPGEVTDEYPYIGSAERTLALAKAAVDRAVERYDDNLTQQEIFNRLTDNGAAQGLVLYNGQLYVNASYINSGIVKAEYIDGENLHVKAANIDGVLVIGQLPSSVAETSDIPTKVSQLSNDSGFQDASQVTTITNNTISTTNVTAQNLKVKAANVEGTFTANKIVGGTMTLGGANNVNGVLRVLDASGNVVVTINNAGADITDGSVVAYSDDRQRRVLLSDGIVAFQFYNDVAQPLGWIDVLKMAVDDAFNARIYTYNYGGGGNLDISGSGRVSISNLEKTLDDAYAEIDLDDDSIVMSVRSGIGTIERASIQLTPDSFRMSHRDPLTGDTSDVFEFVPNGASNTPLDIGNGGTGATNAASARANLEITPANIGALPISGGTMSGDIDMGQAGASSGAPSVKWRTADGTLFSFRPYGNAFQLVRGKGSSASSVLTINSDGTLYVNPQANWRSALGVVPSIVSLTAGADVSLAWQSNIALSGILIFNASVTVNTTITGNNVTVATLPRGYKAAVISNLFLAGRFGGQTHQLIIAANGTSIITGFGATNIPVGNYVLSGVILLG